MHEMNEKYVPYRGYDAPYIFVSYAHKDGNKASEVIEKLQMEQYRVWYDEGIDPGTEWDENIAEHIENCEYFIALLSREYLVSSNCKDELNFARELEKPRLLIYLEDIQLPGGMRMRLSRLQAIHKYKYQSMELFFEKLAETQGLEKCHEKQKQEKTIIYRKYGGCTGDSENHDSKTRLSLSGKVRRYGVSWKGTPRFLSCRRGRSCMEGAELRG